MLIFFRSFRQRISSITLLLRHLPDADIFPTFLSKVRFIERCWSRFKFVDCTDGKKRRVPVTDDHGKIMRYPSGVIRYVTEPIGMIKALPVTQGAPAYVTKYMRKKCVPPSGMNDCFILSSRRNGGIGASFIDSQRGLS